MAKKESTKAKKVVTEKLTSENIIETIANDAITKEVKELVDEVENIIPTEEFVVITETTKPEDILPQLNEKMEELDNVKKEVEKAIDYISKKIGNSQMTYTWNGMNMFE